MKKFLHFLTGLSFALCASVSIAATTPTSMENNWVCETNASSANNDVEKAADEQMENTAKSAADAFAFAANNCRDCTKITCSVK